MKRKIFLRGFTIIELIVVIAIIAILAAIVIVSVVGFKNKSKDAAVMANLDTLYANATSYFLANSNYSGLFSSSTIAPIISAIINSGYPLNDKFRYSCDDGTINCPANSTKWCASFMLKQYSPYYTYYCVDSSGLEIETGYGQPNYNGSSDMECVAGYCQDNS